MKILRIRRMQPLNIRKLQLTVVIFIFYLILLYAMPCMPCITYTTRGTVLYSNCPAGVAAISRVVLIKPGYVLQIFAFKPVSIVN